MDEPVQPTSRCPPCGGPIDPLRARHYVVHEGKIVPFCSPACKDQGPAPKRPQTEKMPRVELRRGSSLAGRIIAAATPLVLGAGVLLGVRVSFDGRTATAALPQKSVAPVAPVVQEPAPPPAVEPEFGPEPPPAGFAVENDIWFHPLPGPVRRLPERPSRMFGVDRDHDSPDSCQGGHCGVDVGEVKGEPVLAVHDGVVERVVRGETGDRGGRYVRLLHYGGRIVTQYMHLDQVASELKPGYHVRAGEQVGTVGDSGTQNSGPHLHFTFATRASDGAPEVYADPLALLTVWPLESK